jgi:hypothetical protein
MVGFEIIFACLAPDSNPLLNFTSKSVTGIPLTENYTAHTDLKI